MKKILITGSNGFLGKSFISSIDSKNIITLGRNNSNIVCDISTQTPKIPSIDIIVHAAGKAHCIPNSESEKALFFNVNVQGTRNILEGLTKAPSLPKSFIYISSVAVYGLEEGENINETQPLLAKDPYGLSKILAENIVREWCKNNNVICTILRLPLVVGINPPGNLGALIRGIKKGYYYNISGGKCRKSMVLSSDVVKIILKVAEIGGIYNLTDGYHPTLSELSVQISKQLGKENPKSLNYHIAKVIALFGDFVGSKFPLNTEKLNKITAHLTFDDKKARMVLGWDPTPVLEGFKLKKK